MPRIEKSKFTMDVVRRSNRFRVVLNVPVKLGLKDGTLVDVSSAGALVTHIGAMKTGGESQMTFQYNGKRFDGRVRVASCNVVGIGSGEGGATLFASRLYFTSLSEESQQIIEEILNPVEA